MKPNTIRLDKTGTFLFRSPAQIDFAINREIAIILCIPSEHACGIAFFHPEDDPKRMSEQLSSLFEKIVDTYGITNDKVKAKIFGLRTGTRSVMDAIHGWLSGNGITVLAQDTGGNACRKLLVDCDTGRVGVSYSESTPPGQLQWIAEGSARLRNPMDTVQAEVLILTENAVKRTLARQAVEEERHWSTACPKRPLDFLMEKSLEDFPYSVVLLFSDIEDEKLVESWIDRVARAYPAVQFRWVGSTLPTALKRAFPELKLLPPLSPELLPEFKKKLRTAVFDYFSSSKQEVIAFQKYKRAK